MFINECLTIKINAPYTRKRFPAFLFVSSNELVVLDSLENSKEYKNAGKRFRVYGAKELKTLAVLDKFLASFYVSKQGSFSQITSPISIL